MGRQGKVVRGELYHKPVAIKIINTWQADSTKIDALKKEIASLRLNPHPNIVRLMGVCTSIANNTLIVTELFDGNVEDLIHSPEGSIIILCFHYRQC